MCADVVYCVGCVSCTVWCVCVCVYVCVCVSVCVLVVCGMAVCTQSGVVSINYESVPIQTDMIGLMKPGDIINYLEEVSLVGVACVQFLPLSPEDYMFSVV